MSFLKNNEEIEKIRAAGKILAKVARVLLDEASEGVSLKNLDKLAKKLIEESGGKPAFLGYRPHGAKRPYPASICASVNEIVVHGIPGPYKLKSGDLLTLDLGVIYEGYHADAAWTNGIGNISPMAEKLLKTTEKALYDAITIAKPGKTLGDIGYAVSKRVKRAGFHVIQGLVGHGIGRELHEEPAVLNEGKKGAGLALEPGLAIAIEPMVAIGTNQVIQKENGEFVTADQSLSAHFEHTVIITNGDPEVVTLL